MKTWNYTEILGSVTAYVHVNYVIKQKMNVQGATEITPTFGGVTAGAVEGDTVMGVVSLVSCGLAIFR